jgi:hypothetical protein
MLKIVKATRLGNAIVIAHAYSHWRMTVAQAARKREQILQAVVHCLASILQRAWLSWKVRYV